MLAPREYGGAPFYRPEQSLGTGFVERVVTKVDACDGRPERPFRGKLQACRKRSRAESMNLVGPSVYTGNGSISLQQLAQRNSTVVPKAVIRHV